MSLGNQIAANLPYLRRYARALTGSQNAGDAFVRAMLEAVMADAGLMASLGGGRVPLYRAFTRVWASAQRLSPTPRDRPKGCEKVPLQSRPRWDRDTLRVVA